MPVHHHRRGLVVGRRRALKKSFGGKTGVWWRADDDNEVVGGGGGGDVEEVDAVDDVNNGDAKEETVANTVVEESEEQEAGTSDGNIETSNVPSTGNVDGDENLDEDEEQEENSDDDQHQQQQQQQNTRKSCWDDLQMGWDDDLCRPIYYHGSQNSSASSSSSSAHGSGDSDNDGEEGEDEDGEDEYDVEDMDDEGEHGEDVSVDPASSPSSLETPGGNRNDNDSDDEEEDLSVEEEETMPAMKKRRRNQQTFGRQSNKRRAIASLIVMDHESEEDEEDDISTASSSPGSEPTTTITNLLTEEVEDLQKQDIKLQAARRISTSPHRSQSTNGDALDDANIEASAFDFIAEDPIDEPSSSASKTTQSRKGKKSTVNRVLVTTRKNGHKSSSSHDAPNPRSSLDDARDYFTKLDETHSLTLDNSETPVVSSRITRTIRGVDLTSPGLRVDYETYVEATVDSGVTPLPIEHFASSRRMNLRQRGDLFDGFLDVDVAGNN